MTSWLTMPVLIEPVFNPNSLITGKLTGNFSNSGLFLRFSLLIVKQVQWLAEQFGNYNLDKA